MPKTPVHCHKPGKEPKSGKTLPFDETAAFYIENEADKKRALDFAAWLRLNKLSPSCGNNGYNWYVNFKYTDYNKLIKESYYRGTYHGCYLKMFNDTWHILPSKDILELILSRGELKEIIWESIFTCNGCNYGCYRNARNTEYKINLFGRDFTGRGICLHEPVCFKNPCDKVLDALKDVLSHRKKNADLEIREGMNIYSYGMI